MAAFERERDASGRFVSNTNDPPSPASKLQDGSQDSGSDSAFSQPHSPVPGMSHHSPPLVFEADRPHAVSDVSDGKAVKLEFPQQTVTTEQVLVTLLKELTALKTQVSAPASSAYSGLYGKIKVNPDFSPLPEYKERGLSIFQWSVTVRRELLILARAGAAEQARHAF